MMRGLLFSGDDGTKMSQTVKSSKICRLKNLGRVDYLQGYRIQQECVAEVLKGKGPFLILCEHPTTLTLGRMSQKASFLTPPFKIEQQGILIIKTDRGGDVTLHTPGQLVAYPILDLNQYERNLKWYLGLLEKLAIDLFKEFGILAESIPGQRGVWVKDKKIASIGIGVKKWIVFHGISLNVHPDLSLFSLIKPCGLDVQMTSLQEILGHAVNFESVKTRFVNQFSRLFALSVR